MSQILDTPASLAELVQYQDGAVVSQALVKSKAGTVSLFAFDAGQSLSEHTVPHDALVYVVDGEAEITVAGSAHTLKTGDVILMPGGKPHAVAAPSRFKMVLTMMVPYCVSTYSSVGAIRDMETGSTKGR